MRGKLGNGEMPPKRWSSKQVLFLFFTVTYHGRRDADYTIVQVLFLFFTVTYHGRRDADYTIVQVLFLFLKTWLY